MEVYKRVVIYGLKTTEPYLNLIIVWGVCLESKGKIIYVHPKGGSLCSILFVYAGVRLGDFYWLNIATCI